MVRFLVRLKPYIPDCGSQLAGRAVVDGLQSHDVSLNMCACVHHMYMHFLNR